VVVLATGGEPLIPDIPGVDGPGVTTAWSVIDGKVPADAKRFIVVGGSATGCEAAIYLAAISEENEIILMEQMSELASDMEQFARQATRRHIAEAANIQTRLGWRVTEITAEGAIAHDFAGERRLVDADAVVLAVGVRPSVGLLGQLSEAPGDVYTIGDCSQPGTIASALRDARVMGALI